MCAGKRVTIRLSSQDFQYLKDRLITPTDLLRAAIREVQRSDKWYKGDNIT
jgi:hypothetical protein